MKRMNSKNITHLGVLFMILSLALVACAPAAPATPAASNNPIPVTGATATPAAAQPTAASNATSQPAQASGPTVKLGSNASLGSFLVDGRGLTLYLFKSDKPGVSNCDASCLAIWPALTVQGAPTAAPDLPGKVGVITRPDGVQQVTYNDMPLYFFVGDKNPGEASGQGMGGLWFVVAPGGDNSSTSVAPTQAPAASQPTQVPAYPTPQSGGGYGGGGGY